MKMLSGLIMCSINVELLSVWFIMIWNSMWPWNYPIKWDEVRGVKMNKAVDVMRFFFLSNITCLNHVNEYFVFFINLNLSSKQRDMNRLFPPTFILRFINVKNVLNHIEFIYIFNRQIPTKRICK